MKAELVVRTIGKALARWRVPAGCIFHSDRGASIRLMLSLQVHFDDTMTWLFAIPYLMSYYGYWFLGLMGAIFWEKRQTFWKALSPLLLTIMSNRHIVETTIADRV